MSSSNLTQVILNKNNLLFNMTLLSQISGGRPLWPAVKANAYGHGADLLAPVLTEAGYTTLCVAHIDEAKSLQQKGVEAIFVLLTPDLGQWSAEIVEKGYQPVVSTYMQMENLSRAAERRERTLNIHLKIDTGMGRVGFPVKEASQAVRRAKELPGIQVASVMSHFPRADEADKTYSLEQLGQFLEITDQLRQEGIPLFHIANSAAIFDLPASHLDLCRPGISIYGLKPSFTCQNPKVEELKPVLEWKTRIIQLKSVPQGTGLSYGHSFVTKRPSLIATIPLGYGDGLLRGLSNKMEVLVGGRRCPQVGRICMDQTLIDVTELQDQVCQGDEVVVIGTQGKENITADELARKAGTINYEIVTQIAARVPRILI